MFSRWLDLKKQKKSFLLMGPRRVGKSTLLRQTFPDYKYCTLDDLDDLQNAKNDPKGFVEKMGKKFIIDECQRIPELTLPIKKLLDSETNVHAILTGSSGLHLREKVADTLAGRIDILTLPPCCFGEENGEASEIDLPQAQRQLHRAIEFGGFPEVLTQPNDTARSEILRNYKNTYFTRDLAMLNELENVEAIKALYQALIQGIGSHYETTALSKATGLSFPTTKKYLATLIDSGLAFKLYGYHQGPAKRYISKAKTYFCDNGMLQALSSDASAGQYFENFVISEIEKRRKLGYYKCDELFFYESTGGREIDLIIEESKELTIIEIKSGSVITGRDFRNIREFEIPSGKRKIRKIILYGGTKKYIQDGIEVIPAATLYRAQRI